MVKESVRKTIEAAKAGDADALAEVRAWKKNQRESGRRVEEMRLRLLQLTEKHWEQSISIMKTWLNRD